MQPRKHNCLSKKVKTSEVEQTVVLDLIEPNVKTEDCNISAGQFSHRDVDCQADSESCELAHLQAELIQLKSNTDSVADLTERPAQLKRAGFTLKVDQSTWTKDRQVLVSSTDWFFSDLFRSILGPNPPSPWLNEFA